MNRPDLIVFSSECVRVLLLGVGVGVLFKFAVVHLNISI